LSKERDWIPEEIKNDLTGVYSMALILRIDWIMIGNHQ